MRNELRKRDSACLLLVVMALLTAGLAPAQVPPASDNPPPPHRAPAPAATPAPTPAAVCGSEASLAALAGITCDQCWDARLDCIAGCAGGGGTPVGAVVCGWWCDHVYQECLATCKPPRI